MADTTLTKEDLVAQLRALPEKLRRTPVHLGTHIKLLQSAADCIEQLQMPPAKVRELAECDEGADSLALMRALGMQIEGQRKHIAALQKDAARLDSKTIIVSGWDEFGGQQLVHHVGIDLRAAIDAAMEKKR